MFEEVIKLCRQKQVSFSLNYEETANTWYYTVDSIAPWECTISKTRSLGVTMESLVEYLEKL